MTSSLKDLRVFKTHPHQCSYLPNQEATTLFVDPKETIDVNLYSNLSTLGFRRSGNHVYRPHCSQCSKCLPVRVLAKDFRLNRSQRRNIKRNIDIKVEECSDIFDDEMYSLYSRYIIARHANGDMYPPSREQYESFLNDSLNCTEYYRFQNKDEVIAVSVLDVLSDGISSIYTFFDPDYQSTGIGTYSILWQINCARTRSLDYVYLGYWIQDCRKMSYKSAFRPLQVYRKGEWQIMDNSVPLA